MSERIRDFIITQDALDAWEDEDLDDSLQREELYEANHDAWFGLLTGEDEPFNLPRHIVLGPTQACLDHLLSLLHDSRWFMRRNAVKWLGDIASENVVEFIIPSLADEDLTVRYAAVRALGLMSARRAVVPLRVLSDDSEKGLQEAGRKALERIDLVKLPDDINIGPNQAYRDFLVRLLKHDHWFNRRYAANWLGKVGNQEVVESLIGLLSDKNSGVRYATARALGLLRDRRALGPLRTLYSDSASLVRGAAMQATTSIEDSFL
jgi:HEAT repeat protein